MNKLKHHHKQFISDSKMEKHLTITNKTFEYSSNVRALIETNWRFAWRNGTSSNSRHTNCHIGIIYNRIIWMVECTASALNGKAGGLLWCDDDRYIGFALNQTSMIRLHAHRRKIILHRVIRLILHFVSMHIGFIIETVQICWKFSVTEFKWNDTGLIFSKYYFSPSKYSIILYKRFCLVFVIVLYICL